MNVPKERILWSIKKLHWHEHHKEVANQAHKLLKRLLNESCIWIILFDTYINWYIWRHSINWKKLYIHVKIASTCDEVIGYIYWHRCWWRMLKRKCVGDSFSPFYHQHPLSFYIRVGSTFKRCHQYRNAEIKIHKLSPTLIRRYHNFTNITVNW